MGLFKNMKDAMGQVPDAQQAAAAAQQQAGGLSGTDAGGLMQARGALEAQAHEQNRILSIGSLGSATIKGHVDTGEQVAGNPVWMLDLEITPEGGAPYGVQKREIISSVAMSGYADGTTMPCRIDPADPNTIAFGDKPFM
ncbi:MAG TPA: hypothetical protein VEX39_11180 [Thermoleophilaceae bacterium]|nr:hypothetical protein [Thermoleophilaceae bacterium]